MFPQPMADSSISPWDKDKKTELKKLSMTVLQKANGSSCKIYTLCNLGYTEFQD